MSIFSQTLMITRETDSFGNAAVNRFLMEDKMKTNMKKIEITIPDTGKRLKFQQKSDISDGLGGNLIFIPYAELDGAMSGMNISSTADKRTLYLKNCMVALISTREHNDANTDVAFVTNIDLPNDYQWELENRGIIIIRVPFSSFFPGKNYQWCLAFYKLCALKYVVENTDYDKYAYLDSDIYCQRSFSDIWKEAEQHVMLYDVNHGLSDKNYQRFISERSEYYGIGK